MTLWGPEHGHSETNKTRNCKSTSPCAWAFSGLIWVRVVLYVTVTLLGFHSQFRLGLWRPLIKTALLGKGAGFCEKQTAMRCSRCRLRIISTLASSAYMLTGIPAR
jgi:hypothetical protein